VDSGGTTNNKLNRAVTIVTRNEKYSYEMFDSEGDGALHVTD